jgi:serine/threonine protein kinase
MVGCYSVDTHLQYNLNIYTINSHLTLHSALQHPNLIKFFGVTLDPLQIVMEFAPFSDLRVILDNTSIELSFALQIKIAHDMAKGLKYLHDKLVTHRDFRSPNIFVSQSGLYY